MQRTDPTAIPAFPALSELKPVADSAKFLAKKLATGKLDGDRVDDSAETVSDFLRELAEGRQMRIDAFAASIPCPPWCRVSHTGDRARFERGEGMRECSADQEQIQTLTNHGISAEVVAFTDLIGGFTRAPEIRVNDDTLTPENALRLAEQIRAAVATATGKPATVSAPTGQTRPGCAPWCADAREGTNCGGECSAEPVEVLATGGFVQYRDRGGVTIPLAETNVHITEAGAPVVHVRVSGPTNLDTERDAWADLTPAEARRYAAAILAQTELAEQVQR